MSKDRQYDGVKTLKCIGRYVLCNKTLGKGNFARVELAAHTLINNKVAVKIIDMNNIKDDYVRRNLFREARLLRRLSHPNIIKLFETIKYTTQSHTLYCLVMELAEGGELLTHVKNNNEHKRLEESKARPFVRQLISALYYLHSKGIVHRDLKMENILLNKKKTEVKIIDFGLSNHHEAGELLSTHCGSPEYAAPELFVAGRQYGAEVDVWSLGVNMYAMVVGKLPFRSSRNHSNPRAKLLQQITAGLGTHQEADAQHLHPSCLNLIKGMLQPDPCKRLKLTAVMQHPWVTNKGSWPLYPYIVPKTNETLEKQVIYQISRLLKVNQGDVKRAIDENRLDWISAIYHLLMRDKEQQLSAKLSNTSLSGEITESTSGVGTSIADEQESKTIEQITSLTLNGRNSNPATPKMSARNSSSASSAKTPPTSKHSSNASSPVTLTAPTKPPTTLTTTTNPQLPTTKTPQLPTTNAPLPTTKTPQLPTTNRQLPTAIPKIPTTKRTEPPALPPPPIPLRDDMPAQNKTTDSTPGPTQQDTSNSCILKANTSSSSDDKTKKSSSSTSDESRYFSTRDISDATAPPEVAARYKYHVQSAPPITRDRDRKWSANSRHDPRMAPIREQRKQEESDFRRGDSTTEQRSQYGSVQGPPPGNRSSTLPKQRSRRVSFSDDTIKRDYFTQYDSLGGTSRTDRARDMAREQQKDYYQDRNQDRYRNPDRRGDQNRASVRNHNRAPAIDQTRESTIRDQSGDSASDQIRGQDTGSMREQNRNFNRRRDPTYNSYRPPNVHNIHDRQPYNDTDNNPTEKHSLYSRSHSAHEGFRDKTYNYSARNFKNFTFYNL